MIWNSPSGPRQINVQRFTLSLSFSDTPHFHCYYHCHQIHPHHIDWDYDYSLSTLQHRLSALCNQLFTLLCAVTGQRQAVQSHSVSKMQPNQQCNSRNSCNKHKKTIYKEFQEQRDNVERIKTLCKFDNVWILYLQFGFSKTLQKLWMLAPATLYWRLTIIVGIVFLNSQKCNQFHRGSQVLKDTLRWHWGPVNDGGGSRMLLLRSLLCLKGHENQKE